MDKTIAAEARIMAIVLETISPKEENDGEHWTSDPM